MALAVVPAVAAVAVTVGVPVVLAVTPAVAGVPQALIASPRLVARPDVVESTKKLAVALPVHEVEPLVTAAPTLSVTEPHEKLPATGRPTARNVPGFVWTTFTVAEFALAVTPKAAGHALIASAMLEATLLLIVATVLVAKCPVKVAPTLLHV